ncbi:MAG: UDP-N-acetylmuramoyl-tripeptide--D-alanyl-D-alanine ligase [Bacteroidales bacterium]|nr:UDP-N-acetylmuramoyl-tripeptide--D-alanyl-D-alanine ligase [Bacteroidales bacterium]MDY0140916.1 UDP-N-acetylmuramoyl-tripeptide--D-alanyl-D-alanine ligase [Bacteroidales bacterium]
MNTIEQIYAIFKVCKKINTDSRIITPNSIFFALKGDNFDGNKYVEDALAKGSIAAVTSDKRFKDIDNIFIVSDTLKALQDLANYHRRQLKIPIIGITGSNGKTTTKELLASVLAQKLRVAYTGGNKNNHIGVPLTLLAMNHTVDIGIIEMGANHKGEIKTLCEIAEPEYGLITNIGKAHLEGFGSIENIKQTKGELYDYLKKNQGIIFSNIDNEILNELLNTYSSVSYGQSEKSYCQGIYTEFGYEAAVKWEANNQKGLAKSNLIGAYNFENILAAITVGSYFNVPETAIDNAIACYYPRNNRSQHVKTIRNSLILDFYNANPTSMIAAIDNFDRIVEKNKCLILGDMLELGVDSIKEHKMILEKIEDMNFRKVYLVGSEFYNFNNKYEFIFFKKVEDLALQLVKKPEIGKFFLIKGSRGIKLEKCTDYL